MTTPNDANDRPGRSGGSLSGDSPDGQTMRAEAGAMADQAKEAGMAQLDRHRGAAAGEIDRLADSADAVAEALSEQDQTGLSHYLVDAARSMHEMADGLRNRNADELLRDASRMARDNPGLFLAGSVAIGFGLSRLARASTRHDHTSTGTRQSQRRSTTTSTTTTGSPWPQSRAGVTGYDASLPDSEVPPLHSDLSPPLPDRDLPGYGATPYGNAVNPIPGRNGGATRYDQATRHDQATRYDQANGRDLTGGPKP